MTAHDHSTQGVLGSAQSLLVEGRIEDAQRGFRDVLRADKNNVAAMLGMGTCAGRRGEHESALTWFEEAARRRPNAAHICLEQVACLRALGRQAEAQALASAFLARDGADALPARWRLHLVLGELARERHDDVEAAVHFQAAAAADPGQAGTHLRLGTVLERLGRHEAAEAAFGAAHDLRPSRPEASCGLARIARARGDQQAALRWFAAALGTAPDHEPALLGQISCLRALGRADEAEAACRELLEKQPQHPRAAMALAEMLMAGGRSDEAVPLLRLAAAASPPPPGALVRLAGACMATQQLDLAGQVLDAALTAAPDDAPAWLALARLARARGDHDGAAGAIGRALELAPDSIAVLLAHATERRERGEVEAAQAVLDRVLAREPEHLPAVLERGKVQRQAGQHEAALASFERAHGLAPGDSHPLLEMAQEARWLGRLTDYERLTSEALRLGRTDPATVRRVADQALTADDPEAALALLQEGLAAQPKAWQLELRACHAMTLLGRCEEAAAGLADLQARYGNRPEIEVRRILLMQQQGDWDAALTMARACCAAQPDSFELWQARMRMELALAEPAEVASCLAAAPVRTRRHRVSFLIQQGLFALRSWQPQQAAEHFEAALALYPPDTQALVALTRAALLSLDLARAGEALRRAAALSQSERRLRGLATSASQSVNGQLFDEYRMDGAAAGRLAALAGLPAAERLGPLMSVVREHPGSTAAAIQVMMAARQAGLLAEPPLAVTGASPITGTVVQYWNTPRLPDDIAGLTATARDAAAARGYRLFDDAAARAYLQERHPPEVLLAYRRANEPAQRADVFRLAFLAAEGGIYMDADDRCVAPLTTILPDGAELVLYQEDLGSVANNFLAAVPHHPVILRALEEGVAALNRGDRDMIWLATGPGLLTRAMVQAVAASGQAPSVWFARVAVLERRHLAAAVATHCVARYKKAGEGWQTRAFIQRARGFAPLRETSAEEA
jgi:tetratricopeptide (TPR) repeat protein